MMIEAYGKGGLVPWLSENFHVQFLEDLLEQTLELRRDSKEREEEIASEEAEQWLQDNKDATLRFQSADGSEKLVDVRAFMWSDEDE